MISDIAMLVFAAFAGFVVVVVLYIGNQKALDSYRKGYREGYDDGKREDSKKASETDQPNIGQPQSMLDIGKIISEDLNILDPTTAALLSKEVNSRMVKFVQDNPKTMKRLAEQGLNIQVYALAPGMPTYEWDIIDRFKLVITSRPVAFDGPIDPELILDIQDLDIALEESKDE